VEEGKETDKKSMKDQAFKSYEAYTSVANKEKVLASDYKSILKYLIFLNPNQDKPLSSYNTKALIVENLKSLNWELLIETLLGSAAASEDTKANQDDSQVQEVKIYENVVEL